MIKHQRKKLYKNAIPLILENYDCTKLTLHSFPEIDDFTILTHDHGKGLGIHIFFYSEKLGYLSSFPWWDKMDAKLKEMTLADIPLGKSDKPFLDADQGWQILIWEKRDYVYVMQGSELTLSLIHI